MTMREGMVGRSEQEGWSRQKVAAAGSGCSVKPTPPPRAPTLSFQPRPSGNETGLACPEAAASGGVIHRTGSRRATDLEAVDERLELRRTTRVLCVGLGGL